MRILIIISLVLLITGCTNLYKPVSEWEKRVFDRSKFYVYPNDVRKDINSHKNTKVAWAGIINEVDIDESVVPALMHFVVEHHFFTWAIDGTTRQYWLSPRGEGSLMASWPMRPEWDLDEMRKLINKGDMVIVYGMPKSLGADSLINLGQASYIRHIPKTGFRTDMIEYGRLGEPTKVLSIF